MAETIGLSASIIGIASAGISVVTALTKFGISYKESDSKIQELAARVSLTVTILKAIGDTVEGSEAGFKKEEFMVTWKDVLDACARNYEKLNDALSKAKLDVAKSKAKDPQSGKGSSKDRYLAFGMLKWSVGGKAQMKDLESSKDRFSTWGKLKWAIGGEVQMKDLENSLEKSAQQVMMMQQVIQLAAIKLLGKSQVLKFQLGNQIHMLTPCSRGSSSSRDAQEQEELMSKMDGIVAALVECGIIKIDQNQRPASTAREIQDPPKSEAAKQFNTASAFMKRDSPFQALNVNIPGIESEEIWMSYGGSVSSPALLDPRIMRNEDWSSGSAGVLSPRQFLEAYAFDTNPGVLSPRRVLEAYFIAPHSVRQNTPEGVFGITQHSPDGYMAIVLNTELALPFLSDAILDAESRGTSISQVKRVERILNNIPGRARQEIYWILNLRKKHSSKEAWDLVEVVEMKYAIPGELDNTSRLASPRSTSSGYLAILRGHMDDSEVVLPDPVPRPRRTVRTEGLPSSSMGREESPRVFASPILMIESPQTPLSRTNSIGSSMNAPRTLGDMQKDVDKFQQQGTQQSEEMELLMGKEAPEQEGPKELEPQRRKLEQLEEERRKRTEFRTEFERQLSARLKMDLEKQHEELGEQQENDHPSSRSSIGIKYKESTWEALPRKEAQHPEGLPVRANSDTSSISSQNQSDRRRWLGLFDNPWADDNLRKGYMRNLLTEEEWASIVAERMKNEGIFTKGKRKLMEAYGRMEKRPENPASFVDQEKILKEFMATFANL